ncbi:MAG TPA: 2Fe-2S iron-sulfur cluster-binding protein [Acidiferrobacterales bacterium]
MSARVKVLPSGREFVAEGAAPLLEEALRAGISLNYGCSNGNCGLCKARLIEGRVERVRPVDYVLTAAEREAGMVLLCAHAAATDLVIEAIEAGEATDIPRQQIEARVRRVDPAGERVRVLHVQTPRTRRLRFLAGQSVHLTIGGQRLADCPIASCPCDDRNLQFHILRRPGDPLSDLVFGGLKPGDPVLLDGPIGSLTYNDDSRRPAIFVAWGTGFALIKSLVEHAMALETVPHLVLYWIAGPATGHYMVNLCRAWADALDDFEYVAFTPPAAPGEDPLAAPDRVEAALAYIAGRHADLGGFDVYVAGPEAAATASEFFFLERGVARAQLVVKHLEMGSSGNGVGVIYF